MIVFLGDLYVCESIRSICIYYMWIYLCVIKILKYGWEGLFKFGIVVRFGEREGWEIELGRR